MNGGEEPKSFGERLLLALVPVAVWFLRLMYATLRIRMHDPRGVAPQAQVAGFIDPRSRSLVHTRMAAGLTSHPVGGTL